MTRNGPHDEPSSVFSESGAILIDGPNGLAAAFTPQAAEETGRRMVRAARETRGGANDAAGNGNGRAEGDGADGNGLEDLSDENVREMEKRKDGAGHAGTGDAG